MEIAQLWQSKYEGNVGNIWWNGFDVVIGL